MLSSLAELNLTDGKMPACPAPEKHTTHKSTFSEED